MKSGHIEIRAADAGDEAFLWGMLALSAYATVDECRADQKLSRYLEGWQRPDDWGFVALSDSEPLGAAWARKFDADSAPYYYLPDAPHEFVLATKPEARRRGIATALLATLLREAKRRSVAGLSLNVREANPAISLYHRHGFHLVRSITNRIGGTSYVMKLILR